jgi:nucleoside-diphosphate-sugar epimerase
MNSRPGDVHRLHAQTDRARVLLGYQAVTPFAEGLEHYIDWFTHTHPDPSAMLEDDPVNWVMPESA